MKLIEPNIKTGKDFMEHLLSDVQKEADVGREKVAETKLDLEELAQHFGAKAKLTGERFEELIRQEVQRQVESYIKRRREHLSQAVVSYAAQVQKAISGIAHQVFNDSKNSPADAVPAVDQPQAELPKAETAKTAPKSAAKTAPKTALKTAAEKPRAKKTLPADESKTRQKNI